MDLTIIGTTISTAIVALGVIAGFLSRAQRQQRAENRKLRAVALAWSSWSYEADYAARRRGVALPPKPRLLAQLEEAHDDEQQPDRLDDPGEPTLPGLGTDADEGSASGPGSGRHAYRG